MFKVKVRKSRRKFSPILTTNLKDVSEFDTLEEYKASIRENLLKERQISAV